MTGESRTSNGRPQLNCSYREPGAIRYGDNEKTAMGGNANVYHVSSPQDCPNFFADFSLIDTPCRSLAEGRWLICRTSRPAVGCSMCVEPAQVDGWRILAGCNEPSLWTTHLFTPTFCVLAQRVLEEHAEVGQYARVERAQGNGTAILVVDAANDSFNSRTTNFEETRGSQKRTWFESGLHDGWCPFHNIFDAPYSTDVLAQPVSV